MIKVSYKPNFIRQFKSLDARLKQEIYEKIDLLKDRENYKSLRVHKLHGQLKNFWSFSVNYKYRIVFEYISRHEIALLMVGDHDVYQ